VAFFHLTLKIRGNYWVGAGLGVGVKVGVGVRGNTDTTTLKCYSKPSITQLRTSASVLIIKHTLLGNIFNLTVY